MAVAYDPVVIDTLAKKLYARARLIAVVWTLIGLLVGGGGGLFADRALALVGDVASLGGAIIGGFVGYMLGDSRGLMLRFAAHQALCQKQIEANTRRV